MKVKHEIIMEHYDKMIEFYGQHGVAMFRKHTHTYSKGYKGASKLRDVVILNCCNACLSDNSGYKGSTVMFSIVFVSKENLTS